MPIAWKIEMFARPLCLLAFAALTQASEAAAAETKPLFSCTLRSEYVATLAIEAMGDAVRMIVDEPDLPLVTIPPQPAPGTEAFGFSHTTGPRGYSLMVKASAPDAAYELHYIDRPRKVGADVDYGSIQAWIIIAPAADEIREYDCDEIVIDVQAMQALMVCDMANRYGARACHPFYPARRDPADPQFDGF